MNKAPEIVQDIEAQKKEAEELKRQQEKEEEEKKRKKIEEEERAKKKANLSTREKKKLSESSFFQFLKAYWVVVTFFLVNVVVLVGFFIINNIYIGFNEELNEIIDDYEYSIEKGKGFLTEWGRQIVSIEGESKVKVKVEKKDKLRAVLERYVKKYSVNDNERGNLIIKIAKREILEKNIPILILELKSEGLNFSVKGLSREAVELVIDFKI